jgi:hypothetical protein
MTEVLPRFLFVPRMAARRVSRPRIPEGALGEAEPSKGVCDVPHKRSD